MTPASESAGTGFFGAGAALAAGPVAAGFGAAGWTDFTGLWWVTASSLALPATGGVFVWLEGLGAFEACAAATGFGGLSTLLAATAFCGL